MDDDTVVYMVNNTPRPVILFQVVKGIVTGQQPDVSETHVGSSVELHGDTRGTDV